MGEGIINISMSGIWLDVFFSLIALFMLQIEYQEDSSIHGQTLLSF